MVSYAYAPSGTLELIAPAAAIEELIERDHGFPASISGTTVRNTSTGATAPVQDYDTYPRQLVQVGNVDKYTTLQNTSQDGVQPDGTWLTTETYGDMPYADAKRIARTDLGNYYRAYKTSYFTAAGDTFSADTAATAEYLTIDAFIEDDPANVDYWIFDTADGEHHVTDQASWSGFLQKWRGLFKEAQTHAKDGWVAVRNATTTNEIRTIMNNLPEIPTDPNNPGP